MAIGTLHSVPIAFQYSSSWSLKLLIAPRTVYEITYVWLPLSVVSLSPILMTSWWLLLDSSNFSFLPSRVTLTSSIGYTRLYLSSYLNVSGMLRKIPCFSLAPKL